VIALKTRDNPIFRKSRYALALEFWSGVGLDIARRINVFYPHRFSVVIDR
jgi:hypothetical protein